MAAALSEAEGDKVRIHAKWKTHAYTLVLPLDCTVSFLKLQIAIQTNVKVDSRPHPRISPRPHHPSSTPRCRC